MQPGKIPGKQSHNNPHKIKATARSRIFTTHNALLSSILLCLYGQKIIVIKKHVNVSHFNQAFSCSINKILYYP